MHAAGQQRSEGDDLRDLLLAVALLHVLDDALAPLDAEIDVEVRHRDAFGIEEALEQQAEPQRIEIGDRERIGDKRARTRTAARPDRNIVVLCPFDEIGDDQEVAGKLHALDDADLEGETVVIILLGKSRRGSVRRKAPDQPLLRLPLQLRIFVDRSRHRTRGRSAGRMGLRVSTRVEQRMAISTLA